MFSMSKLRDMALAKLGNQCIGCGFADKRALQIDHINSDGKIDRQNGITGPRLYNAVLRDDGQRYQLLCANCNWIKREEKGEACKHTIFHDMSLREIAKERDGIFVNEAISFLARACEDSLKADTDACIMNAIADEQLAADKRRWDRIRMAAKRNVPSTSRVRMRQRYLPQP